ncbi:Lrp/AsnC family transcriptional regulator [Rhodococcus qingshengii]|uniref:Lrp/AsnC family transcriptional regulator n=1 Tax=Rhodococcus qingshengii TaxID=334542 RepID=UPI001BE5D072|nr:Lrp/AsnC family transcriptional regulator [Rhodococcus qingshengii]MBT2271557.1 Lrp/AsnC family transcriptional regulator [Rhodococcus qingshengii]
MSAPDAGNGRRIDEIDLRIINALQLAPRSKWLSLAEPLELDAATLARRWNRLSESSLAWVTVTPGPQVLGSIVTAIIEIDCSPALLDTIAARLTRSAHAVTIEASTGRADLLVTAGTADLASMSRFISEDVATIDGVLATRTSIITRWFTEGGRWRLNALAPSEKGVLTTSENRTAVRARPTGISEQDRKVLTKLAYDGRTPMKELADAIGVSPAACKRQIDRLTSSGLVALRCEFARPLAGLPVLATLWCRVEPELLDTAGRVLSRASEVRNCFAVVGPDNLVVQLWLHSPAELDAFETRLRKEIPGLRVTERSIVLYLRKLLGHVLDQQGRRTDTVAPDVWLSDSPQSKSR